MAITLTRYVAGDTTAFITKSNNNMTEIEGHDHNDTYYTETETNNLLDAKEDDLSTPSNDGDILSSTIAGVRSWVSPSSVSGVSGAEPETTATNKTLTSTNSGYQIATASIAFTLPDATTLTEQAFSYLFQNDSTDIVQIKNDSGEVLYRVPPNHQAILNLSDNATADGVWHEVLNQVTHIETLPRIVANTEYVGVKSMVVLDETRTLIVYVEVANTQTMAIVLTTQGTTIIPGTAVQISSSSFAYFNLTLLDTDKVLMAYSDVDNSGYGTAVILSVSDATITVETAGKHVFENGTGTSYMKVDKISTTTAMAAYSYGTTVAAAVVLSVSGTTITSPSVGQTFSTNNTWYIDLKVLTSTLAVVAYYDNDLTLGKTGRIAFSGTSITGYGSNTTIPNSKGQQNKLEKLTDAKAILISATNSVSNDPGAFVLDVTSSSVTVNTMNDLNLGSVGDVEIQLLDSETFVSCETGNTGNSVIRLYNVTGNVITEIDKKILDYNGKNTNYGGFMLALLYDNLFMGVDTDDDLSDYMVAFNFEVTK